MQEVLMKKQIIILFCLSVLSFNVFAGKPVSKELSPLSVLESEEEKNHGAKVKVMLLF